jgi:16S rRNA processing protein RimM
MYLIGKITTTHGIRGEVKIMNLSDYDRFKIHDIIYINNISMVVERSRSHKGHYIVKLKTIDTMNDALLLKDFDVYSMERVNDDSYHYEDIIGLDVKLSDDTIIGKVVSIRELPQGSILEVQTDKKIVLIPFVDAFVKAIEDEYMIIEPIEGLL